MAEPTAAPEEEPIDVEFTSADTAQPQAAKSGGPGWVGLISAGVIAALAGGAIGVVAGGTGGRYASASEVAVDISKLEDADRTINASVTQLRDALREYEIRLAASQEAAEKEQATGEERYKALTEDFARLKSSYLALIGAEEAETTETVVEDDTNPPDTPAESVAEIPVPAISLAALTARMDAMDSSGGSNTGTASRDLARSVADLQKRADELELADNEFQKIVDARASAITALEEDITALTEAMKALTEDVRTNEKQLGEGELASRETLTDLEAELEGLRALVNERLSNLEDAELSQDERTLVRKADMVLALSSLETAIRSGEAFDQELESLAVQLPANARISQLRRFASDGAPTREQLRTRLAALGDAVVKAGLPEAKSGQWAWLDDIRDVFVTVREEGSGKGEAPSQRMQNALNMIDSDDLPGAIAELRKVEGPQADILAEWIEAADRRVRAENLMARLRTDIVSLEIVE